MGEPKQLLDVGGTPMLRRAATAALESGARDVVVVCATAGDAVHATLAGLPVRTCFNPAHERGIGTSIVAGIRACEPLAVGAAIVALADQPFVGASAYAALARNWRGRDVDIVASRYGGSVGAPALFDRALFAGLTGIAGDTGCKGVILWHRPDRVTAIECPEAEVDVDTPEEYARVRAIVP